jgi:cytochrome c oxidase assembly protein subunit 11
MSAPDKNTKILTLLVACVCFMGAMAYASVPLYTLFCRATGFGGTTQRVAAETTVPTSTDQVQTVTVSFDGNVDSALPWDFAPISKPVTLKLGETAHIIYRAHNRGDKTMTGTAVYNVQPDKAGLYFNKIECFCFTKQTLKAGQTVELPVEFYLDPAMAKDANAHDVTHITLSYTFYLAKDQGKNNKQASITSNP